jgi:hypothetical protein
MTDPTTMPNANVAPAMERPLEDATIEVARIIILIIGDLS